MARYRSFEQFQNTPLGMFVCVVLFLAILAGIIWGIRYRAQMQADSYNSMTGGNISADDIILNGDKIRIINPK